MAHGFARLWCEDCAHDYLVAFSCKGRAVCPSCNARRMDETATHLVDHVGRAAPESMKTRAVVLGKKLLKENAFAQLMKGYFAPQPLAAVDPTTFFVRIATLGEYLGRQVGE